MRQAGEKHVFTAIDAQLQKALAVQSQLENRGPIPKTLTQQVHDARQSMYAIYAYIGVVPEGSM